MAGDPCVGNISGTKELINSGNTKVELPVVASVIQRRPTVDCSIHDDAYHFSAAANKRSRRGDPRARLVKKSIGLHELDEFRAKNRERGKLH